MTMNMNRLIRSVIVASSSFLMLISCNEGLILEEVPLDFYTTTRRVLP